MRRAIPSLVVIIVLLFCSACTDTREQQPDVVNAPPPAPTQSAAPVAPATPPTTQSAPTPAGSASAPAATPATPPPAAEVNDKLTRIFQGVVQPDATRTDNALVGDFNGDGSEDIAVVVKPDPAKLADINSEVAAWILNDPHTVVLPDPTKAVQKLSPATPVKVEATDVLLAVIHGYKEQGWRNPDAQQVYLLKNSAGRDLHVQARPEVAAKLKINLPPQQGNLIHVDARRDAGFIYWTGAKYAWLAAPERAAK